MDIHEYQAKEILARFGVPVPKGALAYSPEQAAYRAREIGGKLWVVKAQVHTGGRGKAGGVKLCRSEDEVMEAADDLLGKKLVTHQSGPAGKIVYRLYVEGGVAIAKELYLGFVLDRKSERVMVVASSAGGMEIEEIAAEKPRVDRQGQRRARRRHAGLPGARDRLRAGPRAQRRSSRPSTPSSAATAPSRNSTPPWSRSTR